ncbi:MAG: hypothetical protein U0Y10_25480 [Spirosomataceae bacterium]
MTNKPKHRILDFEPEMVQSKPLTVSEKQKLSAIIKQAKKQSSAYKNAWLGSNSVRPALKDTTDEQ